MLVLESDCKSHTYSRGDNLVCCAALPTALPSRMSLYRFRSARTNRNVPTIMKTKNIAAMMMRFVVASKS